MPKLFPEKFFFSLPHPALCLTCCSLRYPLYPLPVICQDRLASKLASCPAAYSSFYGKQIAPHLRCSRNRLPPALSTESGLLRTFRCSRNRLPLALSTESGLLRTFRCSRNPRNTRNPPCSLRSHGFIARIPCLRYVRTGRQASLPPVLPHRRAFLLHYTNHLG